MKKPKQNIKPVVGDRVKLRGREPYGIIERINDMDWTFIKWESNPPGPKIVDIREVELYEIL